MWIVPSLRTSQKSPRDWGRSKLKFAFQWTDPHSGTKWVVVQDFTAVAIFHSARAGRHHVSVPIGGQNVTSLQLEPDWLDKTWRNRLFTALAPKLQLQATRDQRGGAGRRIEMTLQYFTGYVFTSELIHILLSSLDCGHITTFGVGEYTRFVNNHVV